MKPNPDGTERLIKSAVRHMYQNPKKGDMLMDAPNVTSWRELCMWVDDRDKWRARVRALRAPRVGVTTSIGHHVVLASDITMYRFMYYMTYYLQKHSVEISLESILDLNTGLERL